MSACRFVMTILITMALRCMLTGQQHAIDFKYYGTTEGLSDHYVTSVLQDSTGFIWVSTRDGLNRFDGTQFKNFYFESPENFLAGSKIKTLKPFDNKIGVIGTGGFQLFHHRAQIPQNFLVPDSTSFVTLRNSAWDAARLRNGKFAVTTASGFYVFNPDGSLHFRHDAYGEKDKGKQRILYGRQIMQLKGNDVLIYVESRGLMHYDIAVNTIEKVDSLSPFYHRFAHPRTSRAIHWVTKTQLASYECLFLSPADSILFYDADEDIWMSCPIPFPWENDFTWESSFHKIDSITYALTSGDDGFYLLYVDRQRKKITIDTNKILTCCKVNCIYKDRDSRLWVGTTEGLYKQSLFRPPVEKFIWPYDTSTFYGYSDAMLYNGILYISSFSDKTGLLLVDHATMRKIGEVSFYNGDPDWNLILSMEMYHPDTLWLGAQGGVLWYDTRSGNYGKVFRDTSTHQLLPVSLLSAPDPDGQAWMMKYLGGILSKYYTRSRHFVLMDLHSDPPVPFYQIKHIVRDAFGDVWIGGHSLARWSKKEQRFDTLMSVYGGPKMFNEDIIAMSADDRGSIWIHNSENGLLEYKIREKRFTHFGMKDGFPSNNFDCLSPVVDDVLFLQSSRYLVRFDTRTHKIQLLGNETNLPRSGDINRWMYWDEVNRQMYAFYFHTLLRFSTHTVSDPNTESDLIIDKIIINNLESVLFPGDKIELKSKDYALALSFTVLDYEDGPNYRFAYNLNNTHEWIDMGDQRLINLPRLQSGMHTLSVRATGSSGEQKLATLKIAVEAPVWKQPWLVSIMILVVGGAAYTFYTRRVQRIKEKANLDKQIAEAEMKALHAQMNPHFIFNSLNSIREMIVNKETDDASTYLSVFAQLIRMTLDQSNHSYITLRSTLEYLKKYVEMEKIRTEDFTFRMTSDEALDPDETILPPMLIQPFIENAIWHGVNGHDRRLQIDVTFKKQNDQLVCVIEDDGIGILKSLAKKKLIAIGYDSVSIGNIEKRIELLNKKYNLKSRVEIEDKSNSPDTDQTGTKVTILLPLEIEDE